MIGIIGKFFIGERMFQTIRMLEQQKRLKEGYQQGDKKFISLRAYLMYTDIICHGDLEDKDRISFMMISISKDDKGNEILTFGDYKQFWFLFLEMYAQILQTKITYDDATVQLTHQTFQKILRKKRDLKDNDSINEQ